MTGRSILRRTCALPILIRAMPENEIPPAMRVDYYYIVKRNPILYSNKVAYGAP